MASQRQLGQSISHSSNGDKATTLTLDLLDTASGTSTVMNDRSETQAIKRAFGEHSKELAVSSNKSMVGHSFGASAAVEAVFALLTIRDGIIPPTINYEHQDPECDLDYVPNEARKREVNTVLSNSFGFGGHNATVIFRKVEL